MNNVKMDNMLIEIKPINRNVIAVPWRKTKNLDLNLPIITDAGVSACYNAMKSTLPCIVPKKRIIIKYGPFWAREIHNFSTRFTFLKYIFALNLEDRFWQHDI